MLRKNHILFSSFVLPIWFLLFGSGPSCRNQSDRRTAFAETIDNDEDPQCEAEPHDDESVFGGLMIRIGYHKGALVKEHCFGLLKGYSMLLGIRCRLAGIPFERDFVHNERSNTSYCSWLQGIFSANVRDHRHLPVARSVPGA